MGGGGVVVAKSTDPGYGKIVTAAGTFTACDCCIAWAPVFEQYCLIRKHIKYNIDWIQFTGGDPASANTHAHGGAMDCEQTGSEFIADARECGATAAWSRYPPAFSNDHSHLVLRGCAHNDLCYYQIVAQQNGYNGLGLAGKGGPDPYPDPKVYRTWQQGIEFMQARIKEYEASLMADLSDDDIQRIAKAVWTYPLKNRLTGKSWSAGSYVEGGSIWAAQGNNASQKSLALDTANAAVVKALAANGSLTVEQVTKIVNDAVSTAVSGTVTVDFGKEATDGN